jgi:hypothetical protein
MAAVDPVAGQPARLKELSMGEDDEADRPGASPAKDRIGQQSGRS